MTGMEASTMLKAPYAPIRHQRSRASKNSQRNSHELKLWGVPPGFYPTPLSE